MRILSPSLYVAAVLALPAPALALQLAQAAGTAEDIEQRARKQITERTPGIEQPVQLSAELGTALTRGNTETFHIASTVRLTWAFAERWVSETRARALYEESYGQNTANNLGLFERVDRFLTDRVAAFAAAGIERDIFAGIAQRYSGQLGASFLAVENRDEAADLMRDKLTLELGAYAARENYVLPPTAAPEDTLELDARDIYAARAAASGSLQGGSHRSGRSCSWRSWCSTSRPSTCRSICGRSAIRAPPPQASPSACSR